MKFTSNDPIEQLRASFNTNTTKMSVFQVGTCLIFGNGTRIPLKAKTAWISPLTGKQYSLGSLWLFLEYTTKKQDRIEYFNRISREGMEHVNIADQD